MAYFLGPLLGGEIAQYIGFSSLMSFIGVLNLCYGIYLMVTVLHIFQPTVRSAIEHKCGTHSEWIVSFFPFRNITWMVRQRKINRFHCVFGQIIRMLLWRRTTSDSMIPSMGTKTVKIPSRHIRSIMPIKFQFHAWLSNYYLSIHYLLSAHSQQQ